MAELYVFKTDFEPVMLPGETARVITESDKFDAECIAVGALPEYVKDFGSLSAASWDTDNEDTNLQMPEHELSQLRIRVVTDMRLRFNNLGSTRQWRTSNTNFVLYQYPQDAGEDFLKQYLFKASEFFVYYKDTPRFDFYSDTAQVNSIVKFSGWRFRIKKLPFGAGPRPAKTIWISGWPSGEQGL